MPVRSLRRSFWLTPAMPRRSTGREASAGVEGDAPADRADGHLLAIVLTN